MPKALAVGCPYETFMSLTPKESQCFYEAQRIKREQIDDISWVMGMYMLKAVSVALDHGFNGRKAHSDYFDKPLMTNMINTVGVRSESPKKIPRNDDNLSESEIEQKRKQLVTMLSVMMYNDRGKKIAEKRMNTASSEVSEANGIVNQSTDNIGSDSGSSG